MFIVINPFGKFVKNVKRVFDCSDDSWGNLTDIGMHEWLEKNKDKDIGDYKEEKCKFMTKKYFDYKMFKHPDIHNDPNLEYAEVTSNKPSSRLNF